MRKFSPPASAKATAGQALRQGYGGPNREPQTANGEPQTANRKPQTANGEPYSARSADAGSIRVARRAGIHAETQATPASVATTATSVSGSEGPTP